MDLVSLRTYEGVCPSTQCAAVKTQLLSMIDPPQKWKSSAEKVEVETTILGSMSTEGQTDEHSFVQEACPRTDRQKNTAEGQDKSPFAVTGRD